MKRTPLHAAHVALNAKMAEFAGYDMPINYETGVLAEHNWTREKAGIFDVSHMGQIIIEGDDAVAFWERLTPSPVSTLHDGMAKYTILTNEGGGIIDDLIVTRISKDRFFAVVNAGCKNKDLEWLRSNLTKGLTLTHLEDLALIALQGPKAETVLRETLDINAANLGYMRIMEFGDCWISRLGYTGEDGFEISMPSGHAAVAWNRLMQHPDVKPVGLAARDSLRLEMGYPLYGHDIDAVTTPAEADILWIMGKDKTRSTYIGADKILPQIENAPPRRRIGFKLTGKGIAREGAEIFSPSGEKLGDVTSGGFSPTLNEAIGQGYVKASHAKDGEQILVRVRGRDIEGIIAPLPFVKARTKKG